MATIEIRADQPWSNYHLTIGDRIDPDNLAPYLVVERAAAISGVPAEAPDPVAQTRETAGLVQDYLAQAWPATQQAGAGLALGTVGEAWSFADLIGTPRRQLNAKGLAWCGGAAGGELHLACPIPASHILFAGAGTRLRAIANWAGPRGLMIANCGTHMGPTIAGGSCTASHGSRLGWGGLQDMVRGIHLVTGPDTSIWIERADQPLLADSAVARLGARLVRDNAVFEDALIHLGAMGIVNAVAIELVDRDLYYDARADAPLDDKWDERIAQGRFAEISDAIMQHHAPALVGKPPVFYELTIDPLNYRGPSALHTFYYHIPDETHQPEAMVRGIPAGDAVVGFLQRIFDTPALAQAFKPALWSGGGDGGEWPPNVPNNAYAFYRVDGKFKNKRDPADDVPMDWSQLHPKDEITTGTPGALYNASFAVERHRLPEALAAITRAVVDAGLPPTFIFTARFVTAPAGTLAFTRFVENAVIEIDGASPWFLKYLAKEHPSFKPVADQLMMVVRDGALLVRATLEAAGIPYSMHWGKLGELDAAKVEADFGPSSDPASRLSRWRATRNALLSPEARALFWNEAVVRYGLVERPVAGGSGQP